MTTRRDVNLGRVEPKIIENGAVVAPGLQINRRSLAESMQARPLTREEALQHYSAAEVAEVFGPATIVIQTNPNAPLTIGGPFALAVRGT